VAKRLFEWGRSWLPEAVYSQEAAYEKVMGRPPPQHPKDSEAFKQWEWTPRRVRKLGTAEELARTLDGGVEQLELDPEAA